MKFQMLLLFCSENIKNVISTAHPNPGLELQIHLLSYHDLHPHSACHRAPQCTVHQTVFYKESAILDGSIPKLDSQKKKKKLVFVYFFLLLFNSKQLINQSLNISHVSLIKGERGKKRKPSLCTQYKYINMQQRKGITNLWCHVCVFLSDGKHEGFIFSYCSFFSFCYFAVLYNLCCLSALFSATALRLLPKLAYVLLLYK